MGRRGGRERERNWTLEKTGIPKMLSADFSDKYK